MGSLFSIMILFISEGAKEITKRVSKWLKAAG